ncbi:aminotransferase class V-fold PLP-dependent enzyme, partial [Candidatus Woesearchaeota archaeon]|nr:aminotransferase class V-fold PLP-dependent enzyme [Candidatus Woesearchaeota archaeon]
MTKTIYLDNAATTKPDPKVVEAMEKAPYGNASSTHHIGQEAKRALEESRHTIAKSIKAKDKEIIFTSGGTESNNLALKGVTLANKNKGNHIIISKIEHECVLKSAEFLKSQGVKITKLDVDKEGIISPKKLEKAITNDTILVSIIHGNNEIGTIQNLKEIYKVCKKNNVLFHTDACQSYTKTPLSTKQADLITLNAHKIHGPKGVGALYIKSGINITPLAHGGGHEKNKRAGTENVPGIIGFAKAVKLTKSSDIKKMENLRNYFIEQLLKIPDTKLNGPKTNRLCNNINISFRYIEGESIGSYLDAKGICTSTGSACSSHTLEPSHVIMALENSPERAHGSIRFSISKYTTKEEL